MKLIVSLIMLYAGAAMAQSLTDDSLPYITDPTYLATPRHTMGEVSEYQQNFQMDDGFYVIKVRYDSTWCSVPSVVGAVPHYQAEFSVYQVVDGKEILVGKPFGGQFTHFKCYEDVPKDLIQKAKTLK